MDAVDQAAYDQELQGAQDSIYLLDLGIGTHNSDITKTSTAGRVLRFNRLNGKMTTLIDGQSQPDGLDISRSTGRLFWTNMGKSGAAFDGSVHSARLDGSDVRTVLPVGAVHTPKQLVVDDKSQRLYFCDREGMGVHRVGFDGNNHELLVRTGSLSIPKEREDMTRWCVGISIDVLHGYIYWTQKGPSKSGKGRIFRANLNIPPGQTADSRDDIELVLGNLPEPIDLDLDLDQDKQVLYWTDRGEHPFGCSVSKLDLKSGSSVDGRLNADALRKEIVIIARMFHEPIGLHLDLKQNVVYLAELGGCIYQITQEGTKTVLYEDDASYTGLNML